MTKKRTARREFTMVVPAGVTITVTQGDGKPATVSLEPGTYTPPRPR